MIVEIEVAYYQPEALLSGVVFFSAEDDLLHCSRGAVARLLVENRNVRGKLAH